MSTYTEKSYLSKAYNPFMQAGIISVAVLTILIVWKIVSLMGVAVEPRFAWLTGASFLLLFAMFNSIFSLSAKEYNQYWNHSMLAFLGLAAVTGLLAWLFSTLSINEAGSYRWIYIVVAVAYVVFMAIVGMMKKIVAFAESEVWLHPKKRSQKKSNKK